eukprot:750245-Hanusia_phi.AAC.2
MRLLAVVVLLPCACFGWAPTPMLAGGRALPSSNRIQQHPRASALSLRAVYTPERKMESAVQKQQEDRKHAAELYFSDFDRWYHISQQESAAQKYFAEFDHWYHLDDRKPDICRISWMRGFPEETGSRAAWNDDGEDICGCRGVFDDPDL